MGAMSPAAQAVEPGTAQHASSSEVAVVRNAAFALLALVHPCLAEVTFDWADLDNAGNAPDPDTGFGAVKYAYSISKHEVTNAQYLEFLNAVDPTGVNTLNLFDTDMAGNFGGIERTGEIDGARYVAQAGREQNPVTYVSFFDAMRFANWLHNGQGSAGTETGAYAISDGVSEVRSPDAKFWIPSEDEWYKAAYHDASSGTADVYFDYATGSDSVPPSDQPADNPLAANYFNINAGGYAMSGSLQPPNNTNPLTDVGAYTSAHSPYGTFDQNGNVTEWNEAVVTPISRGLRGGSWRNGPAGLHTVERSAFFTNGAFDGTGFRIATIPEPTTAAPAAICVTALAIRRGTPRELQAIC